MNWKLLGELAKEKFSYWSRNTKYGTISETFNQREIWGLQTQLLKKKEKVSFIDHAIAWWNNSLLSTDWNESMKRKKLRNISDKMVLRKLGK